MKNQKHGLHAAIVTNLRAGHGGSMFAWEVYMSCAFNGIPAILATFDSHRLYPEIGNDLRRLSTSVDCGREDHSLKTCDQLLQIVDEARSSGKMLIIDTRANPHLEDNMFEALVHAGLQDATSVAALVPLHHGLDSSLFDPESHGIRITRTLYRHWGGGANLSRLAFTNTPTIYHWTPAYLPSEVREIILPTRRDSLSSKVESRVDDLWGISRGDAPRFQYVRHVADAVSTIWDTLLKPNTEDVQI